MKQENVIHTHMHTMRYCSANKKGNSAICNNMDGPWEHYAKWNRSDKYKYHWSHLYVEHKKKRKMKNFIQRTDWWFGVGRGWRGEKVVKWMKSSEKVQTSIYKVNSRDVIYSMVTIVK